MLFYEELLATQKVLGYIFYTDKFQHFITPKIEGLYYSENILHVCFPI